MKLVAPLAVLAVALIVRAGSLGAPPYEAHHIRQCDTAAMARNLVRHGLDPFHPRLDWTGPGGDVVESEFPLYAWVVAVGWAILPDHPFVWPRLVTLLASLALIAAVGELAARLGEREDRAPAMLLVAFAPLSIVFGRAVMPDVWALGLGFVGLAALARAVPDPEAPGIRDRVWLIVGACVLGLAALSKLPMLVLWPPALLLVWRAGEPRRNERLGAVLAAAVPVAMWTGHAASLGQESGFSLGVGFESGKWSTPSTLLDPLTWRAFAGVIGTEAVLVVGMVLVGWAATLLRRDRSLDVAWVGAASFGLLALVAAPAVRAHDYYFLPLVAWCSVLAGRGLRQAMRSRGGTVAVAFALVLSAWSAVLAINRLLDQDELPARQGGLLAQATMSDATVVVCDPYAPSVLWAADRQGFKTMTFADGEQDLYMARGATDLWLTTACNGGIDGDLIEDLGREFDVEQVEELAWHVKLEERE